MKVLNSWSMFSMKVAVCGEGVEQLVHVLNEGGRVWCFSAINDVPAATVWLSTCVAYFTLIAVNGGSSMWRFVRRCAMRIGFEESAV